MCLLPAIPREKSADLHSSRLVNNILLAFLSAPRADSKRFEMLSILSTILSWDDSEREKAGLQKVGKGKAPMIRRKSSSKVQERSAEEEAAMNEVSHNSPSSTQRILRHLLHTGRTDREECGTDFPSSPSPIYLSNSYSKNQHRVNQDRPHPKTHPTYLHQGSNLLLRHFHCSHQPVRVKIHQDQEHISMINNTNSARVECQQHLTHPRVVDLVNCLLRVEKSAMVSRKLWNARR